jgi:osmoprotectant transport system ATP-binding protein
MISLQDVIKRHSVRSLVGPVSCRMQTGATTVLIGPSGCGKSTLLKIILGLARPDAGRVLLDETPLTPENIQAARRKIGYVVQEGGLFPHLTAEQNVTLMSRHLKQDAQERTRRVAMLADLVQLPLAQLQSFPGQLSGGQRQRVGLMRALMLDPPVLLLDEPLAALDPMTRYELQGQLKQIFSQLAKTVVLVTHDMNEAAYLGDRIVLLRAGGIVQEGTVEDLLQRPSEPFVSEFVRAQRSALPMPEAQA